MAFEGQALLADVFALVREAVDSDRVHPFVRRSEVELQQYALRRDQVRCVATVGLPSRLLLVDGVPAGRRGIHSCKVPARCIGASPLGEDRSADERIQFDGGLGDCWWIDGLSHGHRGVRLDRDVMSTRQGLCMLPHLCSAFGRTDVG